uniref:Uncharacterized protein n=1 Tax=Populus trichocarpa TaxID=3694 RepID=A9P9C6_POPTR|nr:unknown [Populus trichocarpa]
MLMSLLLMQALVPSLKKWLLQRLTKKSLRNWKQWVSQQQGQPGHFIILEMLVLRLR